jgi:metal-responsive CopG/Arc/MetJ family transcriptional regulator
MKKTISVSVSEELVERVNDQLEYGDSRSEWVEEAIAEKLEREQHEDAQGNANSPPTARS